MSLRPEIRSGLLLAGPMILLIAGVMVLFSLRFRAGDIYPPYSTLRSDPLGTRILHDSLQALPGITVSRNLEPHLDRLDAREATLLFIGYLPRWGEPVPQAFADLAEGGARVIVAFRPQLIITDRHILEFNGILNDEGNGEEEEEAQPSLFVPIDPLAEEILNTGLKLSRSRSGPSPEMPDGVAYAQPTGAITGTDPLPWRSHLVFEVDPVPPGEDQPWQILYTLGGHPVAVERAWGEGFLVLLTDSYLFSNEAMVVDRRPRVLSHLLGERRTLLFDETFHGITMKPGIMGMIRRFRLQGFLFGLLLLALLYVLNQGTALVPPPAAEDLAAWNGGMRSSKGFDALLRRHLPPSKLPEACAREWLASADHAARVPERRKEMEALFPGSDPVSPAQILALFRRMQAVAQRKQGFRQPAEEQSAPEQSEKPRPDPKQDEDHART